jgi:ABC-type transporter Mla subunit MlaD
MDFGLHHTIPETDLPTDWQTLLSAQARALEAILTRLVETVTRVTAHANRQPELVERLHTLLIEAEQFLSSMARQNVGFEYETAQLQASHAAAGTAAPETTERLQVIDQVNATLHTNLIAARQFLTALSHLMEHGPQS